MAWITIHKELTFYLTFLHEFEKILSILIKYYTKACIEQENLSTFSELARDFYNSTNRDGYDAYYALQELFEPNTEKIKIIEFLIAERDKSANSNRGSIDF